jgi:uncharacterized repeat protein (TIGR03803 family)
MKHISRIVLSLGLWLSAGTTASHAQPTQMLAFACKQNFITPTVCPIGAAPEALIQAPDGTLYGAANASGAAPEGDSGPVDGGTVFSLATGKFTLLHSFVSTGGVYPEGSQPGASLLFGQDGNLYGTTTQGGAYKGGVLFTMTTGGGAFAVLYDFCSAANCADGQEPNSLVQGTDGNLYGTTLAGGIASDSCLGTGCGTVFRFVPSTHSFTTLHAFNPAQDGAWPHGLIQASDGNFYGTVCGASNGAGCAAGVGEGYLFRVTPGGQYSVLMTFPDLPLTGLAQGPGGALFGIVLGSCGSELFHVNPDGTGFQPSGVCFSIWGAGTPVFASDGNLWLTSGGTGGRFCGAVYNLSPEGDLLDTFLFTGADGQAPGAPPIQLATGEIAGTAMSGGTPPMGIGAGVVYTIDAGLHAPSLRTTTAR